MRKVVVRAEARASAAELEAGRGRPDPIDPTEKIVPKCIHTEHVTSGKTRIIAPLEI